MIRNFALPDLGEGLTESELIEWHVAVGDTVTLNQPIAEVETAKAIVQLPSPFAGVIAKLYAEPGTTVTVGTPIVAFEVLSDAPVEAQAPADEVVPERNAVLVGYGPAVETGTRPKRRSRSLPAVGEPVLVPATGAALSTPPVRKLAHDLGVDLSLVQGTGEGGAVTREDVQGAASTGPAAGGTGDTRTPIRGVRKATAAVTQWSEHLLPAAMPKIRWWPALQLLR